jgi:Trk K+ transport system NAD-binding subunit
MANDRDAERERIQAEWDKFIEYPPGSDKQEVRTVSALLFAEHMVEMEREACAKQADASADDLTERMKDADWKENITGEQVVNGYRMIGKLIRGLPAKRARLAAAKRRGARSKTHGK